MKFNILYYPGHKSCRVTRSVLEPEVYAFADSIEIGYVIKHNLEMITGKKVPFGTFRTLEVSSISYPIAHIDLNTD